MFPEDQALGLNCTQAGHRPEDFVKQINEEYSRLNAN